MGSHILYVVGLACFIVGIKSEKTYDLNVKRLGCYTNFSWHESISECSSIPSLVKDQNDRIDYCSHRCDSNKVSRFIYIAKLELSTVVRIAA